MDAGYVPSRVHQLSRRTLEAIDALGAMTSSDPAAADALRTVRLTRRNLEDHWMPALRDIERSDTMVRWRASRLSTFGLRPLSAFADSLPDHLRPRSTLAVPISAKRRDQLLRRLDVLERKMLIGESEGRAGIDPAGTPTDDTLDDFARQLAFWVRRDDQFANELVELSVSNLLVGRLLGEARFPVSFAADVARRMAAPNGPDNGVDHDRYALSLSTVLASMTDDPAACLDLLLDLPTAHALASWKPLDAAMLADFVVCGLHVAVDADHDRLADGYEVLAFLTRAANGPLDGGMSAGMATGIAASLAGYIDTLAPAIAQEGATPVVIRAVSPPIELGTYDDLVDLFGAVVRQPEAQSALGTTIAAYTFDTFERVGGDATRRPDLTHLADFADLIGDSSRTEQAELVMAAAVDEARRRQLNGLIGFGTNVALLAGGAGSVARSIAGQAVRAATDWRDQGEPERLPDGQIPAHTYDLITVAAVAVAASDPSMRHAAGLDDVTAAHWDEAQRHVDAIEQLDDPHARMVAVGDLDHWISTSVPALAGYLLELRKLPGLSELKEGRTAVGTD
jgi:hypothetical protein